MEFEYKITPKSSVGILTDEQFFAFGQENRHLHFERTADGEIIIMSPAGGKTSNINLKLCLQVGLWNQQSGLGMVFDSSGGFFLPNGAMCSPDAAWIALDRWSALTEEEKEQFPPLCPDFVVELKSKTDSLRTLKKKMEEWVENGCRLAWLIDVEEQQAYIYKPMQPIEVFPFLKDVLSGEDILPGFNLHLLALQ